MTGFQVLLKRWKKSETVSRPFLHEGQSGAKFDIGGFAAFIAFGGLIFFWGRLMFGGMVANMFKRSVLVQVTDTPMAVFALPTQEQAIISTNTPYPTYTPYPTFTPYLTPTPIYELREFLFSYYDPALGGVNCRNWNDDKQECDSLTAAGLDWQLWYGKGLACPIEYPLWTVFRVIYPENIKGDWVCIDRGGLITGKYLDFLDTYQKVGWNETVKAYIIYP